VRRASWAGVRDGGGVNVERRERMKGWCDIDANVQ